MTTGRLVTQGPLETTVEVGAEFLVRRPCRRSERADDDLAPGRQTGEAMLGQMAESALHTVTDDGVPHGSADHEPEPGRVRSRTGEQVHHERRAATAPAGA